MASYRKKRLEILQAFLDWAWESLSDSPRNSVWEWEGAQLCAVSEEILPPPLCLITMQSANLTVKYFHCQYNASHCFHKNDGESSATHRLGFICTNCFYFTRCKLLTESSELEGSLRGHPVQLPCDAQRHLQLPQVLRALSNHSLVLQTSVCSLQTKQLICTKDADI